MPITTTAPPATTTPAAWKTREQAVYDDLTDHETRIDDLESGSATVSDTAYDPTTWNGVTTVAPSKNAVRDAIENLLDGFTATGDIIVPDEAYGAGWDSSLEVPTKNAVYDAIEALDVGSGSGTSGVHLAYGDSAGDETTTSATAVALGGLTWPSVPAVVDDILEIELTANWYTGTAGNIVVRFDLGGTDGREHWIELSSTRPGVHVVKEYRQVTSGMISGGEVAITADWWRGATSTSANMENDSTRTIPTLAVTNRGAPLA